MTEKKIDVEGILNTLAAVRKQISHLAAVPPDDATGAATLLGTSEEALELFELETLAGALESFASELTDSVETAREEALAGALEIYYAAEELAKDPEHAHLVPIVEQMRESYRRDYGTDIPER